MHSNHSFFRGWACAFSLLALAPPLLLAEEYPENVGILTVVEEQFINTTKDGIRICPLGEVWDRGTQCVTKKSGWTLQAPTPDTTHPTGLSPREYVSLVAGKDAKLVSIQVMSTYCGGVAGDTTAGGATQFQRIALSLLYEPPASSLSADSHEQGR